MKNLMLRINTAFNAFAKDANSRIENGNNTAGVRARKMSFELAALLKEFRKASVNPKA